MNTTIRGHDFRTIVALAALLVLVALVIVLRTTTPTGGGNPAIHARDTGGSSITQDPLHRPPRRNRCTLPRRQLSLDPHSVRLGKSETFRDARHSEKVRAYSR